jgi:biopolymer transport protein ExbB/TolQ
VNVEELMFEVTETLRVPVLILALLALVVVVVELGTLAAELSRRRGRGLARLDRMLDKAAEALAAGDHARAIAALRPAAYSRWMGEVLEALVHVHGRPDAHDRIAKRLAEFDLRSLRRLERSRILVRMGPALGLMGTLIPLSPALAGLSTGDVDRLTENLRVAFGVTVVGLLVGALAFAVALVRDRIYAHDYSDLEYAAARLLGPEPAAAPPAPAPARLSPVPAPTAPLPAPAAGPAPPAPAPVSATDPVPEAGS